MNIKINSCKLILELVDEETGEIMTREATLGDFKEVKKASTSTRTRKPKDTDPIAKIMLLDNKLQLNAAAIEMTGYEPDCKYDVVFEKKGRKITPVLKPDEAKGNRLTKTYTISFRGSRHDNLIEYGDVFELIPYDEKNGWFKLQGNAPEKEDDIVDIPEEISNPNDDEEDIEDGVEAGDIDFDLDL